MHFLLIYEVGVVFRYIVITISGILFTFECNIMLKMSYKISYKWFFKFETKIQIKLELLTAKHFFSM